MTRDELWKLYCKKNPVFEADGNVTMTAKGLKKLFDTTYDMGHKAGREAGSKLETKANKMYSGLFDGLFGTKS
jgi:hypothetical protein